MNTKLTLRLEQRLVRRAKAYAKRAGKSVSQVVAEYFSLLGQSDDGEETELSPTVRSLKGALKSDRGSRSDYRRHLEEKRLLGFPPFLNRVTAARRSLRAGKGVKLEDLEE